MRFRTDPELIFNTPKSHDFGYERSRLFSFKWPPIMAKSISTFLMFAGAAEEAMSLYIDVFPDSRITSIQKYGPGEHGAEGTIKRADLTINGLNVICIDSPVKHAFGFTPAISLFVECATDSELTEAFNRLSVGGQILMPIGNYGFSTKFVWLNDRFGVSWQLNLQ